MLNKNKIICPLCFSKKIKIFYKQRGVPAFNNVICKTSKESINCEKGNISLTFCNSCGFIFNSQLDNKLLKYNKAYDNDQSFSDFYLVYIRNIIDLLIKKYKIKNNQILEVGCGNGKFLKLLCKESNSKGIGIDPAYKGVKKTPKVKFIKDYYSEKYRHINADVLILRHILEHIENPLDFLNSIINNLRFSKELKIVVEVPDFEWISKQGAFGDITYEHRNYFTKESLKNLFKLTNISLKDIFSGFSNQYVIVAGEVSRKNTYFSKSNQKNEILKRPTTGKKFINNFIRNIKNKTKEIKSIINKIDDSFTIWGVAGKGVTFINTLDKKIRKKIPFVIDINKRKQGKYCPGTGHKIVPPRILKSAPIKNIIIMNPNYYDEISQLLESYNRKFNLIKI